jgi:hypothetical protein
MVPNFFVGKPYMVAFARAFAVSASLLCKSISNSKLAINIAGSQPVPLFGTRIADNMVKQVKLAFLN